MKTCIRCNREFSIEHFYRDKQKRDGRTPYCRDCRREKAKVQNDKNPSKARDRAKALRDRDGLRLDITRMGMTPEEYNKLLESQDYRCAICNNPETVLLNGRVRRLSIDHDHTCCPTRRDICGKCNRGLLCIRCNMMLGYAQDNIDTLMSAIRYLKEYSE